MGALTATQIIDEGLQLAGDRSVATRALGWLNRWLASQYAAFPWPFLYRETSGVALNSGAQSITIGSGSGGVTEKIQRINDPIKLYNAAYNVQKVVRLQTMWGDSVEGGATVNPASNLGIPDTCRAKPDTATFGKWVLQFNRVADRALLAEISHIILPDAVLASGVPLYPNDRTLTHAVMADALRFKKGGDDPEYQDARELVASMTVDDRAKYGMTPGLNTMLGLDTKTFR